MIRWTRRAVVAAVYKGWALPEQVRHNLSVSFDLWSSFVQLGVRFQSRRAALAPFVHPIWCSSWVGPLSWLVC